MADLQGFPFESKFTGFDEQENPIFDRAVASAPYRAFWKKYFSNGVFFEPATNFQAVAAGGLNIDVTYGEAHIEGVTILPADAISIRLTLPNALTTGDRTDMIVLRADFTANRSATVYVLPDKSAVSDLQRDESVWELALAKVIVRRNATSVNQADITDLRLSNEYCGMVTEPITRTNTEIFFAQLNQAMANYGLAWTDFFEEKQGQTEEQIAENQRKWDEFYADVSADIGKLLEHAVIRQDQVTSLPQDLTSIRNDIAAKLDVTAQAADSAKLGGQVADYYAPASALDGKANTTDMNTELAKKQSIPPILTLTLLGGASNWPGNVQTVNAPGVVLGDGQVGRPLPADEDAYSDAGIKLLAATTANKAAFKCESVPGADLVVRLVLTEVKPYVAG